VCHNGNNEANEEEKKSLCSDCYNGLPSPKTCPLCRNRQQEEDEDEDGEEYEASDDGNYIGAFIDFITHEIAEDYETFRAFRRLFADEDDDFSDDDDDDDYDDDDEDEDDFFNNFEPASPNPEHAGLFPLEEYEDEDPADAYEREILAEEHIFGYF